MNNMIDYIKNICELIVNQDKYYINTLYIAKYNLYYKKSIYLDNMEEKVYNICETRWGILEKVNDNEYIDLINKQTNKTISLNNIKEISNLEGNYYLNLDQINQVFNNLQDQYKLLVATNIVDNISNFKDYQNDRYNNKSIIKRLLKI